MQTFSVRDLREHTGKLIHGAEAGHLAIVTKHSKPVFLAVPFDEVLIEHGLHVAVAIDTFKERIVSLGKAAKIANLSIEEFIEKLAALGISTVDYPPDELDDELKIIDKNINDQS